MREPIPRVVVLLAALGACDRSSNRKEVMAPESKVSGSTSVQVAQGQAVATVDVSPASGSILVGATILLTATAKDANGNVIPSATISWASSNTAVATVSGSGLVTGMAAGSTTITARSGGKTGTATITVSGGSAQVTYYSTNFTDGTTGRLDVYAYGGGSCAPSIDYRDPGSAYSIKCTISDSGAAALQAWFGNGKLAGTVKDPSLDQDLFEEVRFVLAQGAAASIGGTLCTSQNSSSQFKTHKSVYGQVGSAVNGWIMSEIAPCSDGNIGMFSEAEMWRTKGVIDYPWPGTYPLLNEGSVYDVVYRYHRYTAQKCGTIAIWVNGTKILDSPCWDYMGTTKRSSEGLLFWDGATYLSSGLGPLVVYNLFAQATNYPIGVAAASAASVSVRVGAASATAG